MSEKTPHRRPATFKLDDPGVIVMDPDDAIRLALSRAVAVESARGWKISKDKQTHKIDVVIALARPPNSTTTP